MKKIPVRNINTTAKEPERSRNFNIRDLQDLLNGEDMVQELHRHDFFYVLALKKGKGTHEIDFTSYNISHNSIFIMRPGQVHQLTLKAGSTGYMMAFKADFYSDQFLRKAGNANLYQPDLTAFTRSHTFLSAIFQEYTDKRQAYQEAIKANLQLFFIELMRQHSSMATSNTNLYPQERLEEFTALVTQHLTEHKQASEYADMMHLSLYQLNTITKATLGKTCTEIINEQLILEAKRYLLATSGQVNQIADELGYEDVSYFIRFFRKHTGLSPEAFRQAHFR